MYFDNCKTPEEVKARKTTILRSAKKLAERLFVEQENYAGAILEDLHAFYAPSEIYGLAFKNFEAPYQERLSKALARINVTRDELATFIDGHMQREIKNDPVTATPMNHYLYCFVKEQ